MTTTPIKRFAIGISSDVCTWMFNHSFGFQWVHPIGVYLIRETHWRAAHFECSFFSSCFCRFAVIYSGFVSLHFFGFVFCWFFWLANGMRQTMKLIDENERKFEMERKRQNKYHYTKPVLTSGIWAIRACISFNRLADKHIHASTRISGRTIFFTWNENKWRKKKKKEKNWQNKRRKTNAHDTERWTKEERKKPHNNKDIQAGYHEKAKERWVQKYHNRIEAARWFDDNEEPSIQRDEQHRKPTSEKP